MTDAHEPELEQMSDDDAVEVVEIRAELDETREEMGDTLTQLGDRLDPGNLMDQAKENVREATIGRVEETATRMSDMVMETIKRNPVPAAIAGAGLAMLWMNRSGGSSQKFNDGTRYTGGYRNGYQQEQGSGLTDTARDAASRVGEAVGGVGETVGSVGQDAGQAAGEMIGRAGETAQQVGWRLERFMQASPLAMGAIAAGAGAVVGALVPSTPVEQDMLGDASQQVGERIRDTVGDVAEKAQSSLDEVEEKVTSS